MKRIKFAVITLAAFLSFGSTFAQEGLTQLELNEKHANTANLAEKQMKEVLVQIYKEYADDPVFLNKLREAQKAWEVFSEKELIAIYPPRELGYYGSMMPMCVADWRAKLVQKRTEELRRWVDHSGGGCSESMEHIILEGGSQQGTPAEAPRAPR